MNWALVENPNATHLHKFLVFRAVRAGDHVLALDPSIASDVRTRT